MDTKTEWKCPFCRTGDVAAVEENAVTMTPETPGRLLLKPFAPLSVSVTHRRRRGAITDEWTCRGNAPTDFEMP